MEWSDDKVKKVEASAAASRAQEGRVGEAALDKPRIELKSKVKAASVRKWQRELDGLKFFGKITNLQ